MNAGMPTTEAIARWEGEGGASPIARRTSAEEEIHLPLERKVLEQLGAAVVAVWSDLPRDVQQSLFRSAARDEEAQDPSRSRGIARFLHDHKDAAPAR